MKRLLVFAAAIVTFLAPARGEGEGFIRVDEDEKAVRLQTGVTRFEKNGAIVDLIGAVHIGDKSYFQALNKKFEAYEVLLFEMVGGENLNGGPVPAAGPEAPPNFLRAVYDQTARLLDLTGQVDHIDYTAENFLHADLTAAEFAERQAERGESLLTFALEAEKGATPPDPFRFIFGLLASRADLLKLSIIHTLGDSDDRIAPLAGDNVVIGDRNIRCLEVMDRELAAGRKNLGIFYGAAHFPDMEKRLIEQGFTRTTHDWITAWNVLKPIKK